MGLGTEIAIGVSVAIVLGAIASVLYWFVFSKTSTKQAVSPIETTGPDKIPEQLKITMSSKSLSVKGTLNIAEDAEFASNCEPISEGVWHCKPIRDEFHDNYRPPRYYSSKYMFAGVTQDQSKFVFHAWRNTVLRVPLLNVTGEFDNMVLVHGVDFWSQGFKTEHDQHGNWHEGDYEQGNKNEFVEGHEGENHEEHDKHENKSLEDMISHMIENVRSNSTVIIGSEALPAITGQGKFEFNVINGSTFYVPPLSDLSKIQSITRENQQGMLRMSIKHLDYHFKLNNMPKTVRIFVSSSNGLMGDLQLKIGEQFMFYDRESKVFVVYRPASPSSMWNRPHESENGEQQHEDEMQPFLTTIAQTYAIPIPVGLVDMPNCNKLHSSILVDLILDCNVGFIDQENENISDADILQCFTIQNIGLRASLSLS